LDSKEAAMAAITFNTARQKEAREQLNAALTAYREMLDAFVKDRMPRTEVEADQAPTQRVPNAQPKSMKPQ
jgi:hypothetical protein